MPDWTANYLTDLKKRSKESRAYQKHQVLGLEIAETLKDPGHKALYIKLAKIHNPELLLRLAKGVAERKNVRNPGAYFMRLLQELPTRGELSRTIPPFVKEVVPRFESGDRRISSPSPSPTKKSSPRKPKELKSAKGGQLE